MLVKAWRYRDENEAVGVKGRTARVDTLLRARIENRPIHAIAYRPANWPISCRWRK